MGKGTRLLLTICVDLVGIAIGFAFAALIFASWDHVVAFFTHPITQHLLMTFGAFIVLCLLVIFKDYRPVPKDHPPWRPW